LKDDFAEIIMNMGSFEFEDRKSMQTFITELYNNYPDVIEEALNSKKEEIVNTLVDKYPLPGMSPFVGNLLRLFTKSNVSNHQ
jgi:hypothetical protein